MIKEVSSSSSKQQVVHKWHFPSMDIDSSQPMMLSKRSPPLVGTVTSNSIESVSLPVAFTSSLKAIFNSPEIGPSGDGGLISWRKPSIAMMDEIIIRESSEKSWLNDAAY